MTSDDIQYMHNMIPWHIATGRPLCERIGGLVRLYLAQRELIDAQRTLIAALEKRNDLLRLAARGADGLAREARDERDRATSLAGRFAVRIDYLTQIIAGETRNAN